MRESRVWISRNSEPTPKNIVLNVERNASSYFTMEVRERKLDVYVVEENFHGEICANFEEDMTDALKKGLKEFAQEILDFL